MLRTQAAAALAGLEAFQGIPVQVEVVTPREPYHQMAVLLHPEAQGAAAFRQFCYVPGELLVVTVALAAVLAAALQLFSRVKHQKELLPAPLDLRHPVRRHIAVQVFERAQLLLRMPKQGKPVLTSFLRCSSFGFLRGHRFSTFLVT